jgi:hydroxyacylglutathione hydrolase
VFQQAHRGVFAYFLGHMILKRFYEEGLAQASYLVGAETTAEALIIDPNRDVEAYIAAAAAGELRITHVTETHIHADFLSGARELVRRTGARLLVSAEGDADWQYRIAPSESAELLRDGDSFAVGEIRVDVRHAPGHTPEHLLLLVTDGAATDRPLGAFTGDFIFAGDVGRPDLLERAAHVAGTMEHWARALFLSLRKMREYPEYLQLWPGHGAGSACGKSLGAMPSTTLGYERLVNWAFQIDDEREFVKTVLAGQPEPPGYFGRMKLLNRDGPPRFPVAPLHAIDAAALARAVNDDGTTVIDARGSQTYAAAFIPGTINIPAGSSFVTWGGSLLSPDAEVVLLVEQGDSQARDLARQLALVGVDHILGWGGSELFEQWKAKRRPLERAHVVDAQALAASDVDVIDVRGRAEFDAGHIPGARHVFLGDLPDATGDLPRDRPIVVSCQGGTRSSIGASLLRARGFSNVINFSGGFTEWRSAGLPVETADASSMTG